MSGSGSGLFVTEPFFSLSPLSPLPAVDCARRGRHPLFTNQPQHQQECLGSECAREAGGRLRGQQQGYEERRVPSPSGKRGHRSGEDAVPADGRGALPAAGARRVFAEQPRRGKHRLQGGGRAGGQAGRGAAVERPAPDSASPAPQAPRPGPAGPLLGSEGAWLLSFAAPAAASSAPSAVVAALAAAAASSSVVVYGQERQPSGRQAAVRPGMAEERRPGWRQEVPASSSAVRGGRRRRRGPAPAPAAAHPFRQPHQRSRPTLAAGRRRLDGGGGSFHHGLAELGLVRGELPQQQRRRGLCGSPGGRRSLRRLPFAALALAPSGMLPPPAQLFPFSPPSHGGARGRDSAFPTPGTHTTDEARLQIARQR